MLLLRRARHPFRYPPSRPASAPGHPPHCARHAEGGRCLSPLQYNVVTFLPYFLFEMFSRAAYLYFLLQAGWGLGRGRLLGVAWAAMWAAAQIQPRGLHAECAGTGKGLPESRQQDLAACCTLCHSTPDCARLGTAAPLAQAGLSWWSVVSPFGGVGSTAALVFVLLVAGVKAVWEDTKRHQEDKRMNTSVTHRVNPDGGQAGGWGVCAWVGGDTTELCMGRVVRAPQVPVLLQQFVMGCSACLQGGLSLKAGRHFSPLRARALASSPIAQQLSLQPAPTGWPLPLPHPCLRCAQAA